MRLPRGTGRLLLPLLLACGESNAPDLHGPESFTAKLDGVSWVADTAVASLFGSICDTTLLLSGVRAPAIDSTEEIFLFLHGFRGTTTAELADSGGSASAGIFFSHDTIGGPPRTRAFWSTASAPGHLRISGVTVDDSLISGSFAFQGALHPDTAVRQNVSGSFRVRYIFQPVFVPSCS